MLFSNLKSQITKVLVTQQIWKLNTMCVSKFLETIFSRFPSYIQIAGWFHSI